MEDKESDGSVDGLRSAVESALVELEAREGVTVVFAAEKSSRVFGSHHAGSDSDVVALFAWPTERYLSLRPVPTALTLQLPVTEAFPEVRTHLRL
jgi:hypothetical protein